ncbi:TPA: hypothetical protein EYP27_01650, partial [Candidatus Bathyarchaeota archaeon]|nr:hypothetical protein [Candidatus Bathyarchaeota archaeon]
MAWKVEEASQRILKLLANRKGKAALSEICKELRLNPSPAMRTILTLQEEGLLKVSEKRTSFFKPTPEGEAYVSQGLPERRLVEVVLRLGGIAGLEEALEKAGLSREVGNIAIGWIVKKGWGKIRKEAGKIVVEAPDTPPEGRDEILLKLMVEKGQIDSQQLEVQDLLDAALEL